MIQIVLATMTGNRRATWVVALACAAFYALVFPWSTPAHFWHAPVAPGVSIGMHALGMWVAVLIVAIVITFFMTRIIETLGEREDEMRRLHELASRNARLASLTTLAAGSTLKSMLKRCARAFCNPSDFQAPAKPASKV